LKHFPWQWPPGIPVVLSWCRLNESPIVGRSMPVKSRSRESSSTAWWLPSPKITGRLSSSLMIRLSVVRSECLCSQFRLWRWVPEKSLQGGRLSSWCQTVWLISGSASGGMSIALDLMSKDWLAWAQSIGMSPQILHRVASMASVGMDTLPHNGAIITLLAVCGLTHRQAYLDIFALTLTKTVVAFIVIAFFSLTGRFRAAAFIQDGSRRITWQKSLLHRKPPI